MATLIVKVVDGDRDSAERAREALGIDANLDFETGNADYDYAELCNDDGVTIWSTDFNDKLARKFLDKMYS